MLITAISIEDYKRVRKVAITPAADAHLILLGGKNMQGKTSTLDALTAAFGGGKMVAADPVRHGATEASIFVELDGGKLTIDRTIDADGKTKLEVRDADGAVRKPQDVLDKLVGSRTLDPLAFLRLPAKDQRAALMKVIPDAARIDDLDAKRARAFERRTELNRELTRAKGELERLPAIDDVGTPVDVAALSAELAPIAAKAEAAAAAQRVLVDAQRKLDDAKASLQRKRDELDDLDSQIARLMKHAEELRAHVAGFDPVIEEYAAKERAADAARADAFAASGKANERRTEIEAELARADAHNAEVHARKAHLARREEAAKALAKFEADSKACTEALATIDQRKVLLLGAAKLPVDGLAINDDGIMLAGVPFEQASGAEKLRVALAIAIAASPGLDDVWVRDAAILDDEQLAIIAEHAAKAGKRVWLERIGTRDPGVIEIRDGQVV